MPTGRDAGLPSLSPAGTSSAGPRRRWERNQAGAGAPEEAEPEREWRGPRLPAGGPGQEGRSHCTSEESQPHKVTWSLCPESVSRWSEDKPRGPHQCPGAARATRLETTDVHPVPWWETTGPRLRCRRAPSQGSGEGPSCPSQHSVARGRTAPASACEWPSRCGLRCLCLGSVSVLLSSGPLSLG